MKNMNSVLLVLFLVFPILLFADDSPPNPETFRLTLAEATDRALAHSARLAQFGALRSAAESGLRQARAERYPLFDLSGSITQYSSVRELTIPIPGGGTRTIFPNITHYYRTSAGVSVPLYTGGRLENAVRQAQAQVNAAAGDLQTVTADLTLETVTAYWNLVAAQENERVLREAIASYESHLKDAKNRMEVGLAASNEVLAVQVERDRAELARLQAENNSLVANDDLVRLVGLPQGSVIEPVEPVLAPMIQLPPADELVASAVEFRPEIAALRMQISAAESNVRIQKSARLPQAGLAAGYDFANPNVRILPLSSQWEGTWSVGVNVNFTVFDWGRVSSAAARAEAEAEALRHQLEDLERLIRLEVTTRVLDVSTAQSTVTVAERNREAAIENTRVARDRYREGVIPSSELLDAETSLLRAGLERTTALAQLNLARANLNRATGKQLWKTP